MAIRLPLTRLPELSTRRAEMLLTFDPDKERVDAFVTRFTEMGLRDKAWDIILTLLFRGSSKKQLLEAIALNKIATTPGGSQALERNHYVNEPENSSKLLLAALDPGQREIALAKLPELREGKMVVMRLDPRDRSGDAHPSVDLVLTQGCFRTTAIDGAGLITPSEVETFGWMDSDIVGLRGKLADYGLQRRGDAEPDKFVSPSFIRSSEHDSVPPSPC